MEGNFSIKTADTSKILRKKKKNVTLFEQEGRRLKILNITIINNSELKTMKISEKP